MDFVKCMVYDKNPHACCYYDDDFAIDPSNICSSKALTNFTVSLRWIKCDLYYLQEHSLENISTSKHIQRTLQGNSWNCCSTQSLKWECFAKRWIRFPLSVHLQNLFFWFLFFVFFLKACKQREVSVSVKQTLPITLAALYPLARRQFETKKVKL